MRSSRTYAQSWREAWAVPGTPVWILAGALVLWSLLVRYWWGQDPMWATYRGGALVPLAVQAGEWWRVLTAGLLHVELLHLGVNVAGVALLGRVAQRILGAPRAILVFLVATVVGSGASLLVPGAWSLGASAGVYGLLGALIAVMIRVRQDTPRSWRKRAQRQMLPWLLFLVAVTLAQSIQANHLAHLSGVVVGAVSGCFMGVVPLGAPRWSRWTVAVAAALVALGVAAVASALSSSEATYRSVGPVHVPSDWVAGPPLPPCTESLTDGLRFVCVLTRPRHLDERQVRAEFEDGDHALRPAPDRMDGWTVLGREPPQPQFLRVCLRRDAHGWTAVALRAFSRDLYLPHAGCELKPAT